MRRLLAFTTAKQAFQEAQLGSLRAASGLYVWPSLIMLGELATVTSGVAVHLLTSCCVALRTSADSHRQHPCKLPCLLIFTLHARKVQNNHFYV